MPFTAAHAKLNLHLAVLAREASGYHQIETLFCMLELADDFAITLGGDGVRLEVEGAELGPPETNLAHRAATAFFEQARLPASARIRIVKKIPAGAGLGGGSSDAATTLLALNALHGYPVGAATLREIGMSIGSDVPFFLAGRPLALAWGRGEQMLALPAPPSVTVVVVVPSARVATRSAYEALAAARATGFQAPPRSLTLDDVRDIASIAAIARNDFETVVFETHPELRDIKSALAGHGAIHAMLTGTGSAVFGLFQNVTEARLAAASMRSAHPDAETIVTATRATTTH